MDILLDKSKNELKEKFMATMILHAIGDTIGFKNGEWEFKYHRKTVTLDATHELLYEFIHLGGINRIDLSGWMVSDDTLFNMGIGFALLESKDDTNYTLNIIKTKLKRVISHLTIEAKKNIHRYTGIVTNNSIAKFTETKDARTMPYDPRSGGNGAAMRTHCIGLAYHGSKNRDKLIEIAVESSRMTHNSPIGYLGGLVSALFTAYAIEGVHINKWPFKMLKIVESKKIKSYIRKKYKVDETNDYLEFIQYWKKYIDMRFDGDKVITSKAQQNILFRSRFYHENFTKDTAGLMIGDSGYSSVIMAYDCLLDAGDIWEKLIIYSALHWGDSDTVAAIACGWFGAKYGFSDVPSNNLKYLEYKEEIENLGENLYKKFVLGEVVPVDDKVTYYETVEDAIAKDSL
jgi:ADP-ribosylarginine hydrolase